MLLVHGRVGPMIRFGYVSCAYHSVGVDSIGREKHGCYAAELNTGRSLNSNSIVLLE